MSNLPLQPLVWHDASGVDGVYSERTDSYIKDALWFCSTLVAEYVIRKKDDKYVVNYGGRTEPEYETLNEAKKWCEHTHYRDKMQPYVVPTPTKVYELAFDYSDGYFTVFMTTDEQVALDFIESVKKHDEQFICDTSYDTYEYESINDEYNDNHPLKPYASKIFDPIYEDSFSEYMNRYAGHTFASNLSIIEHELFEKQGE